MSGYKLESLTAKVVLPQRFRVVDIGAADNAEFRYMVTDGVFSAPARNLVVAMRMKRSWNCTLANRNRDAGYESVASRQQRPTTEVKA